MNELTHKEYQKLIADKIHVYLGLPVETEWRAMKKQPSLYCPRVDVAVGPYVDDDTCITDQHDLLIKQWKICIKAMLDCHKRNMENLSWEICRTSFKKLCYKNKTARCFMAIEIEETGNRKHLIGDIINTLALGRLGVVVTCSNDRLRAFIKIRR